MEVCVEVEVGVEVGVCGVGCGCVQVDDDMGWWVDVWACVCGGVCGWVWRSLTVWGCGGGCECVWCGGGWRWMKLEKWLRG